MTLRKYLILMSFASIICWIAFALVVYHMNPIGSGIIALVFFYLSLFLAVVGTFAIIGFLLRSKVLNGELVFKQVAVTFRQALWFGLLAVFSLWLQSKSLLTWYNLSLLIIALLILEFFFLSTRKDKVN